MRPAPAPPGDGDPPLWDDEHIKALLRLSRFPARLIQQDPWQTWIEERGGLEAVYAFLRSSPLPPSQHELLNAVLEQPEVPADRCADRLNISRSTYFNRLRDLIPALAHVLNRWEAPPAPLAAADTPSQLPAPLTGLVGVEPVLQRLTRLLLRSDVRLLTLLGIGGIGKTRLSLELTRRLAAEFADGAAVVGLAPLRDPLLVGTAIAHTLGVSQAQSGLIEDAIKLFLRDRALLLVLDNFEQVVEAAPLVTELLAAAPRLKVLVTSRIALRVYGEHEFLVPPLSVPDPLGPADVAQLAQTPAVALFVQRARAVNAAFQLTPENAGAVADLCVRLDGLPLAIELAAAQAKLLSPQAMLVRLSSRLQFLNQGPRDLPARQQTLRGTLDWSYTLLTTEQQALFTRLGVFIGGCRLDAIEAVCNARGDILAPLVAVVGALIDNSLLQQQIDPDGEPRFVMLETIREYALAQLEVRGELAALGQTHAMHYLAVAERAEQLLGTQQQLQEIELFKREQDNVRATVQWFLAQGQGELCLRLVELLWNFWKIHGNQSEGLRLVRAVLDMTGHLRTATRVRVLCGAGWLADDQRDYAASLASFQEALELAEAIGDGPGLGMALQGVGEIAQLESDYARATSCYQRSLALFRSLGNHSEVAWSLDHLGRVAMMTGDLMRAQAHFSEALALFRQLNHSWGLAISYAHLGQLALFAGNLDQARAQFNACVQTSHAMGESRNPMVPFSHTLLGEVAIYQGDYADAREQIQTGLTLSSEANYGWCVEMGYYTLGLLYMRLGPAAAAAHYLRESLRIQQSLHEPWRVAALFEAIAELAASQGRFAEAARLGGAAAVLRERRHVPMMPVYRQSYQQHLSAVRAQLDPSVWSAAWSAGAAISWEQALAMALRILASIVPPEGTQGL